MVAIIVIVRGAKSTLFFLKVRWGYDKNYGY